MLWVRCDTKCETDATLLFEAVFENSFGVHVWIA
jgi:hypothetical protein